MFQVHIASFLIGLFIGLILGVAMEGRNNAYKALEKQEDKENADS